MSYELPDPQRDEDELVPSCSPAKSGPGQIAAKVYTLTMTPWRWWLFGYLCGVLVVCLIWRWS